MPRRDPPLILGGARPKVVKQVLLDPLLPTGAAIEVKPRPLGFMRQCSVRRPVCVQLSEAMLRADTGEAARALRALENAYERSVLALALPEPLADAGRGGSDALDAYLFPPSHPLRVVDEADGTGPFTEASGYCELPLDADALLDRNAALCVGEAQALRLDASEPPHLRRAFASWLWWTLGSPTALDLQAVDEVQAHPERAIATRDLNSSSEGAALFFEYLESTRSSGATGELAAGLFAAAVSNARPYELTYKNDPDLFDVLRHSLEEERDRFAQLMVNFSVARAFLGDRDDGVHLPTLGWTGAFGRVRYDWLLRFSSLPRRVLVNPPVDSSGSVLLWLDIDEAIVGAGLGIHVDWEPPVSFHWQVIKLDANGSEMGRVDVPYQERAREADMRVSDLIGARAVLLVGTNLEGIDLAHPFDPDVAPFEPHGATLYLVRL